MDPNPEFLYDYVLWQWPIRWVVTLAFYAFAFKLTAAVLRYVLLGLIGFKRWAITAERSLSPEHPATWRLTQWLERRPDPDSRIATMTYSIMASFYRWLSPSPAKITAYMSSDDRRLLEGKSLPPWPAPEDM